MMLARQETDFKDVYPSRQKVKYAIPISLTNETIGSEADAYFFSGASHTLVAQAQNNLQQLKAQELVGEAQKILLAFQEAAIIFQRDGTDLSQLPQLHAYDVEDGSLLIQWRFEDFRIGFTLEPNPSESGWYLVSNSNLGQLNASGYISGMNLVKVAVWLIGFALLNS